MFITGLLVSLWLMFFDSSSLFLSSIFLMFIFIMEIYFDYLSISTYWFLQTNPSILCSCLSTKNLSTQYLENPIRRSMFLRIQNLFRRKPSSSIDHHPSSSLFDYRCPVCFNSKQSAFPWIALGCGHILCSFCLQHLYFSNKPICPQCRSIIILSDSTVLYI